jgi:hypothetical protein
MAFKPEVSYYGLKALDSMSTEYVGFVYATSSEEFYVKGLRESPSEALQRRIKAASVGRETYEVEDYERMLARQVEEAVYVLSGKQLFERIEVFNHLKGRGTFPSEEARSRMLSHYARNALPELN